MREERQSFPGGKITPVKESLEDPKRPESGVHCQGRARYGNSDFQKVL